MYSPWCHLCIQIINRSLTYSTHKYDDCNTSMGPMAMSILISFSRISLRAAMAKRVSSRSLRGRANLLLKSSMNSKIFSISLEYFWLQNLPNCILQALVSIVRPSLRRSGKQKYKTCVLASVNCYFNLSQNHLWFCETLKAIFNRFRWMTLIMVWHLYHFSSRYSVWILY